MHHRRVNESAHMQAGLYIVGTPIGNLEDITYRAVTTLREVDLIMAEDTRRTRHLLARYELSTPMVSCHKFNEASRVDRVLRTIDEGKAVALVTDSGMPAISDPGARVVAACREAGVPVTAIPGPTAVSATVALSGMGGKGFHFDGFLPHKSGQRRKRLGLLADLDQPLVLFESPYRLLKLMNEIEEVMGSREVFVGRELTKKFEECILGTPGEIRDAFSSRSVKGELVVVIAPQTPER